MIKNLIVRNWKSGVLVAKRVLCILAMEESKKARLQQIGTHDGTFHCDEVLACFMLKVLPEFEHFKIIRTRDPTKLAECEVVVDVGGVYDPSKHRYDHHQRSFNESMNSLEEKYPWITKLSSAGLVYFHFGQQVISNLIDKPVDDPLIKCIYNKVYERFVEEVDAIDNGINIADGKLRYSVNTNLSSRIGHLNPAWNEDASENQVMDQFTKAIFVVGQEFKDKVNFYYKSWWPARELVQEALASRNKVHISGQIIVLSTGGCPWKEHLLQLEEEQAITGLVKYVLYTDQNERWRVQCVPVESGSFESRLPLCEKWRGVRDEELSQLAGIAGCIFVHASGFIGGNKTYEGALEMAVQCLDVKS